MQSGNFESDIIAALQFLQKREKHTLDQLEFSGEAWEQKQQSDFIKTGSRSYQLWDQCEGTSVKELMKGATSLIFDSESWYVVHVGQRTEARQLTLFKASNRMGTSGYTRTYRRRRRWHTQVFETLRNA